MTAFLKRHSFLLAFAVVIASCSFLTFFWGTWTAKGEHPRYMAFGVSEGQFRYGSTNPSRPFDEGMLRFLGEGFSYRVHGPKIALPRQWYTKGVVDVSLPLWLPIIAIGGVIAFRERRRKGV
jgi:hypothetical protein